MTSSSMPQASRMRDLRLDGSSEWLIHFMRVDAFP